MHIDMKEEKEKNLKIGIKIKKNKRLLKKYQNYIQLLFFFKN